LVEELTDSLILNLYGPDFFLHAGGQLEFNNNSGAIYMAMAGPDFGTGIEGVANYLAVVRNAELTGIACDLDTIGLYLGSRKNSTLSLPNFANYDLGPLVGSPCDTLSPLDTTQTGLHHQPLQDVSWSINPTISSSSYTVSGGPASWMLVHDLYGQEVLRQWHEEQSTFDLTGQPAGVYLVSLRAVDGTTTLPRKIVRQ
jgi:hypothetical protein